MRNFSRSALISILIAALAVTGLGSVASPAAAAAEGPPTRQDTARLLGYMWGDGEKTDGVWDVNGPSGTSSLIEELVEVHGGTWVDRGRLRFRLPAPYNFSNWKDGLPDDSSWVRAAVLDPHFLAALMETEASVFGQIYDQSRCCVPGYTRGRLTELRDLLRDRGFSTATFVQFNNVDSGRVVIDESEWAELRSKHRFACPTSQDAIRIPGGYDLAAYGNLRWIQPANRWGDLVRSDCPIGRDVKAPTTLPGSCSASAAGNKVTVDWTFTKGDAVIRRDGKYITTVSGRDGTWSQSIANGTYLYQVRLLAFGVTTYANCGSVSVPGGDTPPPPPAGPCTVAPSGNQVLVSWDDFGKNRYSVRRNGSWAGAVTDGSRSMLLSGSIDDTWELRYNNDGQRVNVPCTAGTPEDGPCRVTSIANGVRISWDPIPGKSNFQIRRNGSWLASVTNVSSYDDSNGSLGNRYTVRYRNDGNQIDIPCA